MPSPEFPEPMTFYPTLEEWKDLPSYVSFMESQGAHLTGIVKVVAPPEWEPNRKSREERYNPSDISVTIENPLMQTIKPTPVSGAFQSTSKVQPPISVETFVKLATSERYVTPAHESYEQLEELYWSYDLIDRADDPIYGADVPASLIDEDRKIWNVGTKEPIFNDFGRKLTRVEEGAYLYFGMWKSTFSWHIEDMDLYGVNYLHYGAPKSWYCVPPSHAHKLELAAKELFSDWSRICYNFLRHKVCMISPKLLTSRGVKVHKVVQEERDLIIVFPHAYHAGFNHGFNIAEASNFGTPRWIDHGKRHRPCTCSMSDTVVKIDMDPLVERFQPGQVEAWRSGQDVQPHPNDSPEMKEVWRTCQDILRLEASAFDPGRFKEDAKIFEPRKVRKQVEGSDEPEIELVFPTNEEKISRIKKICQKQIEHFVRYRDTLPEIQDLLQLAETKLSLMEVDYDASSDKENMELDQSTKKVRINMQILKRASKVKVKINKQKFLKQYIDKLPQKPDLKKPIMKQMNTEVVKKHGFADLSSEELEAKRSMKKCYFKHKFWPCRKCSGCVRPDCGECMYCKDKSKFGGHNILKQKCIHKKCSNPVVRSCERCQWNL